MRLISRIASFGSFRSTAALSSSRIRADCRTMSIEVHAYDPAWPSFAAAAITELQTAHPGVFTVIEHLGSTAVPGLPAKPVIDLMAAVDTLAAVPDPGLGYTLIETGMPERLFYRREPTPAPARVENDSEAKPTPAPTPAFLPAPASVPASASVPAPVSVPTSSRSAVAAADPAARPATASALPAPADHRDDRPAASEPAGQPATPAGQPATAAAPTQRAAEPGNAESNAAESNNAEPGNAEPGNAEPGKARRGKAEAAERQHPDPAERPAVHLHIVTTESWPTRNERLLRDHLLRHPAARDEYGRLKQSLAATNPDGDTYTRAKTDLIQRLVDAARTERGLPLQPVWET
ncbi:GrpB family protein [Dactylosporangium sp. CA-139114]|uniref:GrpB family protein n=1 Tax=Dactylosporangium sp. CA-139114 TaxID=3239931 RepID=UPI003D9A06B8